MTTDEWAAIAAHMLLAYPNGTFTGAHSEAYYTILGPYPTADVAIAVSVAMAESPQFIPPAPAIRAALYADYNVPTFIEAYDAIYGPRGALRLATYVGFAPDPVKDDRAYARARDAHPLVELFIRRYGLRRLQLLEVDHEKYGPLRRAELKQDWDALVDAQEVRGVAAVAAREGGARLRKLDPLGSLPSPPDTKPPD